MAGVVWAYKQNGDTIKHIRTNIAVIFIEVIYFEAIQIKAHSVFTSVDQL